MMNQQHRHETIVSQAMHNAVLEGLNVSSRFQEDCEQYIAGAVSADELPVLR